MTLDPVTLAVIQNGLRSKAVDDLDKPRMAAPGGRRPSDYPGV
jgi:hypothetical protein